MTGGLFISGQRLKPSSIGVDFCPFNNNGPIPEILMKGLKRYNLRLRDSLKYDKRGGKARRKYRPILMSFLPVQKSKSFSN